MGTNLYVGNLPWSLTAEELKAVFAPQAQVLGARIAADPATGHSRGFGFVEVADSDAARARQNLNGIKVKERELIVNEARPRQGRA